MKQGVMNLHKLKLLNPCWLQGTRTEVKQGREKIRRLLQIKKEWNVMDILTLAEGELTPSERIWAVSFVLPATLSYRFSILYATLCCCKENIEEPLVYDTLLKKSKFLDGECLEEEVHKAEKEMWDATFMRIGLKCGQDTALNRVHAAILSDAHIALMSVINSDDPQEPIKELIKFLKENGY